EDCEAHKVTLNEKSAVVSKYLDDHWWKYKTRVRVPLFHLEEAASLVDFVREFAVLPNTKRCNDYTARATAATLFRLCPHYH
uniref:Uncharacterized protein n=1 Tax=Globisporangium ultimum (strain ATCC 200006 / CBS 805.95 / DAOM BR144) TaxID=431595 RepID=K3X0B9_GLOUD